MKVFNKEKTEELQDYDLSVGELVEDKLKIFVKAHEEIKEISHYEPIKRNDFTKVIDREYSPKCEDHEEEIDILVYVPFSTENIIRKRREKECFPIINRGKAWYDLLTINEEAELQSWYIKWLDAPETGIIPERPKFLDNKINVKKEIIL